MLGLPAEIQLVQLYIELIERCIRGNAHWRGGGASVGPYARLMTMDRIAEAKALGSLYRALSHSPMFWSRVT